MPQAEEDKPDEAKDEAELLEAKTGVYLVASKVAYELTVVVTPQASRLVNAPEEIMSHVPLNLPPSCNMMIKRRSVGSP